MQKRWFLVLAALLLPVLAFAGGQTEGTTTAAEGPVVLTAFWSLDAKTGMTMKSYAEMTVFQEMEKATGVRFDFKHPPAGQEKEQFNLMLASNDLTDVIYWNWFGVPGGPGKVVGEGQIIRLNELLQAGAPHYLAHLAEYPDRRKQVTLDDGTHYMFPKFKHDKYVRISHGFQVREDWIKKLGIDPPGTIDEWYAMLKAFKQNDLNGNGDPNDEIPYGGYDLGNYSLTRFAYAFGATLSFVMQGNKVAFGPILPGYKDYLATMRKWYAEGLIDPDFASIDRKGFEAKIVGDITASYAGLMNGHMGKFLGLKKDDPNFALLGIQPPLGPAGKRYGPMNHEATGTGLAISSACADPEAAVRWGDYLFTDEGILLTNFGKEGVSWTYVNGEPTLTDLIKNNPDGLPMINALSQHVWSAHDGPGLQLERTFKEIQLPPQINAVNTYQATTDTSLNMPLAQPTPEEGEELATIMNDIDTYVQEMHNKFVMGQAPMSDWDNYVSTIKRMGIDDALKTWQKIVERYEAK